MQEEQNAEYDEWLDNIINDEELAERLAESGILTRLKNLQR